MALHRNHIVKFVCLFRLLSMLQNCSRTDLEEHKYYLDPMRYRSHADFTDRKLSGMPRPPVVAANDVDIFLVHELSELRLPDCPSVRVTGI
jgi:hypothetical protein